jgi:hypothetical protein
MENTQKHYTRGEINKANQSSSIGLIIRQKEPKVLETPLDRVDSFRTPTELFYVRSQSPAPKLELASYRLQVDGAVRCPFSLTYKELRDMPAETRIAILERAGLEEDACEVVLEGPDRGERIIIIAGITTALNLRPAISFSFRQALTGTAAARFLTNRCFGRRKQSRQQQQPQK